MNQKQTAIKELKKIPGVGESIANDLWNIGIQSISDLNKQDPQSLYEKSNKFCKAVQDRCLLYVFRCAVYFASTPEKERQPDKLKWWYWKDSH